MQKKTKLIGNIIFMLLLLGATMYLLLKDQDLPEIRRLLRGASGSMILFAVLCAVMYLILESTSLIVILRSLGERMHFFPSLRYSFIGFLFNALTPSASGGQPMMVLYMKADGINMGASSVAMLFWTIIYKIALVIVEAIVVLFYHPFMVKTLGHYQWLFWVGMAVNVVSIVLYGIIVFSKNGARYIVRFATWLLHKVRLVKRRERLEKKLDHMLEAYEEVRPLDVLSRIDLYYRLAYPEKFWKIANSYYCMNKAWISVKNTEKLKTAIKQTEEKKMFLKELFGFEL
mgnify:CR=1 FL=1